MQKTRPEPIVIPEEDIPIWMKKARQGTDWGVLIVLAFSLIAAWPFVLRSNIPAYGGLEHYAFSGAEYAQSLREFRLYPRWSTTAQEGYGAPIPHYYPPGVPYVLGALEVLITGNAVAALRIVMVAGFMLLGTTTYAFVTRYAGATAGLLAAILYMFSPYVAVTTPVILGDVPQFLAMSLLPTLLWSVYRLLTMHRPLDFTLCVLIASAIVLSYPLMIPVALFLSGVLMSWHLQVGDHKLRVLLVVFAWLFAGAITTFYWIPAIVEHSAVQWRVQGLAVPDVSTHLADLVAISPKVNPFDLAPAPHAAIGWALILFAISGAILLISEKNWYSIPALLLGAALVLVAFMIIHGHSAWLVGPVALCLAVVGAETTNVIQRLPQSSRFWAFGGLLATALIGAYPAWLAPRWPPYDLDVSPRARIEYERQGFGVAALPPGAALPTTLVENIAPNFELITSYATGKPLRLRSDQLAVGSQVNIEAGEIHSDTWIVSTSPLIVDIQRAYFAGWAAYLNGERIPLLSDPETGLMQIVLPRIERALVQIRLESTPLRRRAWWLSLAAITVLAIGLLVRVRRPERVRFYGLRLLDRNEVRILMTILVGFVGMLLLISHPDAPYASYARGYMQEGAQQVGMQTADGLRLRSFELADDHVKTGGELGISLYWSAAQPLQRNYRVAVVLESEESNARILASEPHTPALFPTQRWLTTDEGDYFVHDQFAVAIPQLITPGRYRLAVEVYDCIVVCELNSRRQFVDNNGQSTGQTLPLPVTITVGES